MHVLVSMHPCVAAVVRHPDVSAASLDVCHWDSGGGVKVTCFKYRQCHDNMPDSTYKTHLHNVPPLSLAFSLNFFPSSWETGRADASCFAFVSAVQMQKDVMSRLSSVHNLRRTMKNGTKYKHRSAAHKDKIGSLCHYIKCKRLTMEACQYSMSPLHNTTTIN